MATWVGTTSDYNSASNWTGGDMPDVPGESAIFSSTGSTTVTVNAPAVIAPVNPDSWTFSSTAQSYAINGVPVTLNSGIVNNSAVAQTIANRISGTGSVLQNGSGMLTLTGDNSYTGGTTIASGTLKIGNGGTTGSITGDVIDNGTLIFNQSGSGQTNIDGKISGTGSVVIQYQSFAGFVFLLGENTYTGGTTIASGALVIGNLGTTGSVLGNIINNGQLTFNRADSITFDGLISG